MCPSYRNQSVDLHCKSVDQFLYYRNIDLNPLSANHTKWLNTLKTIRRQQPTNCLSVFDHFVGLALKGLYGFSWHHIVSRDFDFKINISEKFKISQILEFFFVKKNSQLKLSKFYLLLRLFVWLNLVFRFLDYEFYEDVIFECAVSAFSEKPFFLDFSCALFSVKFSNLKECY